MLHLTKVAFGCDSLERLAERLATRAGQPGGIRLTTRYRPKRHEELVGGSLYWIVKHRLIGRSEILGFADAEGGRTDILLAPPLIAVRPRPCRAHQGWRYLNQADAPPDLIGGAADGLPAALAGELAAIGLL